MPSLDEMLAIEVGCDGCGRGKRLDSGALARLCEKGLRQISDVRSRLVCTECGERDRLSLIPVFRRAEQGLRTSRAA
ncbi:hypothetical protein OIU35_31780 [Boseaceae bacterium BT-24-1]|nr:hypothetical protein [Boseaceae bacterium BT-24-1]